MDPFNIPGNKLKVRLANAIRITAPASRHHLIRQLNSMVKYTLKHPERCDYKVTRTAMSEPYNTRKFARYEIITGKLVLEIWVETLVVKMSYRIRDTARCDPALPNSPVREQIIQLWEGTSITPNGTVTMAGIFTMIFIDVNCDESRELSNYFNEVWQTPSAKKAVDIHLSAVSDDAWGKLTKQSIDHSIQARTLHIDLEGMDDAAVNEWVQGMKKTTASFTLPAGGFKHAADFDVVEMYGGLPPGEMSQLPLPSAEIASADAFPYVPRVVEDVNWQPMSVEECASRANRDGQGANVVVSTVSVGSNGDVLETVVKPRHIANRFIGKETYPREPASIITPEGIDMYGVVMRGIDVRIKKGEPISNEELAAFNKHMTSIDPTYVPVVQNILDNLDGKMDALFDDH